MADQTKIPMREPLFQRLKVEVQCGPEDAVGRALELGDRRTLLCHRGTLDPLAYWIDCVGVLRLHPHGPRGALRALRRGAVIHLVTAADGAPNHYRRCPKAHRPDMPEDEIRLDRLLEQAWSAHPHHTRIDNVGREWPAKAAAAQKIIERYLIPQK